MARVRSREWILISGGGRLRHRLVFRLELRLDRLALDLALADQPEGQQRAGERRAARRATSTSLKPAQEAVVGGVRRPCPGRRAGRPRAPGRGCPTRRPRPAGGGWSPSAAGVPAVSSADLVGASADEDRAPDGDADGDPDLAEGVVDPGGHPALLLRHDAERRRRRSPGSAARRRRRRPGSRRAASSTRRRRSTPRHQQQPDAADRRARREHQDRAWTRDSSSAGDRGGDEARDA